MYGLVNKAIEGLVCDHYGEETWDMIKEKANVDIDAFISMDSYDDEVSYKLVKAASEILGQPPEQVLEVFGEYWVLYTAKEGYGEMLKMAGDNLVTFLSNLDNLHTRIGLSFPQLQPPSIKCTDVQADSLRLHYYSTRPGLAPMVIGLVKGLGKRFNEEIDITQTMNRDQGADHDEFFIHLKAKQ